MIPLPAILLVCEERDNFNNYRWIKDYEGLCPIFIEENEQSEMNRLIFIYYTKKNEKMEGNNKIAQCVNEKGNRGVSIKPPLFSISTLMKPKKSGIEGFLSNVS